MSGEWLAIMLVGFLGALLVIVGALSLLRRRRHAGGQRATQADALATPIFVPLRDSGAVLPFDAQYYEDDTQPYTAVVVSAIEFAPMLDHLPTDAPAPAVAQIADDHDPEADAFTIAPQPRSNPNLDKVQRLIAYLKEDQQPAESAD